MRTQPCILVLLVGAVYASDPRGVLDLEGYGNANPVRIDAKRCKGDFGEKKAVASGDTLLQIDAYGHNGTNFTTTPKAAIKFKANQNWTSSNNGSKITFETTPNGSSTPVESFVISENGNLEFASTGDDVISATTTMDTTTIGESRGFNFNGTYAGTSGTALPATLWATMNYNQTGYVSTAHGGAIFGRVIGGAGQEGFSFGVEGNAWGVSTSTDADVVGVIGHSVWKHDTSTPTCLTIGVNARSEVTNAAISVNRATGTVIGVRSEVYGGLPGLKYSFYGVNSDGTLLNAGSIIKVRKPTIAMSNGDTINVTDACGGVLVITSTGVVSTGAVAFTAPSSNITDGTFNEGCEITVVNGNLTGGRSIIFKHSASNLYTTTGADIVVGALGGSFRIASYPTAGLWLQTTTATK